MVLKKIRFIVIAGVLGILLAACSNDTSTSNFDSEESGAGTEEKAARDDDGKIFTEGQRVSENNEQPQKSEQRDVESADNRKIIYTGNLHIEVKDYQQTVKTIENQVAERGGYIVESTMHEGAEKGSTSGQITVRIPQEKFRSFIKMVEEGSKKVIQSSITGRDVTEEYVDLESRLKSKRVVEKRLTTFMEQAEKTEDLLKISEDLAAVQEEIEQITGRMKFLENKADFATMMIRIEEKNVRLSGINEDELNTWEKTKNQFMKSINFLIAAFSGLVVFFVGNLPVLIIAGAIVLAVYFVIRRRMRSD